MQLSATLISVTLPAVALLGAQDDDTPEWGGFRGNNGSGIAASEGLPEALDAEATALWRVEVPTGYSSPIVAGERVFITATEDTALLTMCFDRWTGEELWTSAVEFDGTRVGMNSSAAASPATDGERLFVTFHAAGLIAYDLEGEELWRRPLGDINIPHGMSTSPLVHGDLVIQLVDQDLSGFLAAYDKETGEERWRADRAGVPHGYSTPAVHVPAEGPAEVVVSGAYQVSGYSAVDGEKLWWVDGSAWQTKAVPVFAGDLCIVNAYMIPSTEMELPSLPEWEEGLKEHDANGDGVIGRDEWDHDMIQMVWFIFDLDGDDVLGEEDWSYARSTATATGGLFGIRVGGRGDVTESHLVWRFDDRRGLPDAPSPIVVDDTLFLIKDGGLLTAIDAGTGEIEKQGRVGAPDQYYASPVSAAGRLVTASHGGQLAVIEGGSDWEVVSVHDIEEEIWSTPAIAGGQVFVRSQEALWCFQDLSDN